MKILKFMQDLMKMLLQKVDKENIPISNKNIDLN